MDGRSARWSAHNDAQRRRIVGSAIEVYDEGRVGASIQEIGARAGLSRSVVYRQFADRRDLEDAVQRHLLAELWELLGPDFAAEPSRESFRRATATYVEWAATHPRLHQVAGFERSADGPLRQSTAYLSARLGGNLVAWLTRGGAVLGPEDEAAIDALAHGVVGLVFATVRHWVDRGDDLPPAPVLTDLVAEAAWSLVEARVRASGLDADAPV